MAAAIAAMFTAPVTAVCTVFQGANCAISTINLMSCLCQGAMGKKTGVSPTAAKMFYILLLGVCAFTAAILRYHSEKFNFGGFGDYNCANDGSYCKGDQAVFRISFILVLFFTAMMLVSLADESFHRGYWGIKALLVVVGIIGAFFIPAESFNVHAFAWFARLGSLAFLVLQILILIDFAYQINESWVAKAYGGDSTSFGEPVNHNWLYAILGSSAALYVFSLISIVLLYIFYSKCPVGITFTSLTLVGMIIVTVLSVLRDKIVEREMQGAILPCAVVVSYAVFLCWSALESNPHGACRPSIKHSSLDFTFGSLFAAVTLMWSAFSVTSNAGHLVKGEALEKAGTQDQVEAGAGVELGGPVIRNDLEEQMVDGDDDDDVPVYSHENSWMFHLVMITASLYLSMLLTDWGSAKGPANAGEASMWMKIVAQWLTVVLFGWTLIAPAILKDRDFE